MRDYVAFMAEGGGLGKVDADPYAPVKAYLSARDVWQNPGRYAGWPRPEAVAFVPPPDTSHGRQTRDGATPDLATTAAPAPGAAPAERPDLRRSGRNTK